jgi:hypothetical protein
VNVSDKMLIRPVKHGDFAQWKPLWDGYSAFYGRKDKSALPDEITNLKWSRFFDGYEPLHAQVADCSGQLLGLAHFLLHRSTTTLTSNCCCRTCSHRKRQEGREQGAR